MLMEQVEDQIGNAPFGAVSADQSAICASPNWRIFGQLGFRDGSPSWMGTVLLVRCQTGRDGRAARQSPSYYKNDFAPHRSRWARRVRLRGPEVRS